MSWHATSILTVVNLRFKQTAVFVPAFVLEAIFCERFNFVNVFRVRRTTNSVKKRGKPARCNISHSGRPSHEKPFVELVDAKTSPLGGRADRAPAAVGYRERFVAAG